MSGEHDDAGPQAPGYADKGDGHSGGPGGHARERLDELIGQRVPTTEDTPDACEPTKDTAGTAGRSTTKEAASRPTSTK